MAIQEHYIWCPADGRCGCGQDVTGHDAERLRAGADAAQAATPIWAAVLRAMAERREPAAREPRKWEPHTYAAPMSES